MIYFAYSYMLLWMCVYGGAPRTPKETIETEDFGDFGEVVTGLWPTDKPIEFYIDIFAVLVDAPIIEEVFQYFSDRTCLSFKRVRKLSNESLHIRKSSDVCGSRYAGKFLRANRAKMTQITSRKEDLPANEVFLSNECFTTAGISHEIGHALGLYHTHQRSDRDRYVTIRGNRNYDHNWQKADSRTAPDNLGTPYDYGSMMHYAATTPNDNSSFMHGSIRAKNKLFMYTMGAYTQPSQMDLLMINKLYKCNDRCKSTNALCQYGGFPNPKKCHECICPQGLSGAFCEKRQESSYNGVPCGSVVDATNEWQTLKGGPLSVKLEGRQRYGKRATTCHWQLKTSMGYKIEVIIERVGGEICVSRHNCERGGVELVVGDFRLGGYKFCCNEQLPRNHVFRTNGSLALINLSVVDGTQSFEVRFRRV